MKVKVEVISASGLPVSHPSWEVCLLADLSASMLCRRGSAIFLFDFNSSLTKQSFKLRLVRITMAEGAFVKNIHCCFVFCLGCLCAESNGEASMGVKLVSCL